MTQANSLPWEGTENPHQAIFDHFTAEIAKLEAKISAPSPVSSDGSATAYTPPTPTPYTPPPYTPPTPIESHPE
jgi:hypothetical protein